MKKKFFIILTIFALLSIAARTPPARMTRLTVINKSGMPIEMYLTGSDYEYTYTLRMLKGTRLVPLEQTFTVFPDTYSASLYYVEPWDPVYGYSCSSKSQTLDANHVMRITILECDRKSRGRGEPPSIIKFGISPQ